MGLGSDAIGMIMTLKKDGYIPKNPAVIEIGAQQLANSFVEATQLHTMIQELFEVKTPYNHIKVTESKTAHGALQHLDAEALLARDFWKWLGFTYASIDIDGSEGSIPLDLNYDSVDKKHIGKYNLVTNFGTTEHVANQLNAFKVIHDLTAPGGVMLHHLPMQGMLNHGLFNYNPKFFWMLARSNGYKVVSANCGWAPTSYDFPENIVENIAQYNPKVREHSKRQITDSGIVYILQKIYDMPYIPPIDVPSGTTIDNKVLKKRYWTVFEQRRFMQVIHYLSVRKKRA